MQSAAKDHRRGYTHRVFYVQCRENNRALPWFATRDLHADAVLGGPRGKIGIARAESYALSLLGDRADVPNLVGYNFTAPRVGEKHRPHISCILCVLLSAGALSSSWFFLETTDSAVAVFRSEGHGEREGGKERDGVC